MQSHQYIMSDKAKWYVVHTYSGHENKVKANIEKMVENRGKGDLILEVAVPTEEVKEVRKGEEHIKRKKIFPGYCLVKMIMTDESWYIVRNTRGVTGFVGPESKPVPLTEEEIYNMGIENHKVDINIEEGDRIVVIAGPFEGFEGVIESIDYERQVFKAIVSMFGRETPVELEFTQVQKG